MNKKLILVLIMIFTILGILIAGTLTLAKYSNSIALLCGEDENNSCNTVQSSDYAYLINVQSDSGSKFQIPLTLAGVIFYIGLFSLSLIAYKREIAKVEIGKLKYYLFSIGTIGLLFSAIFTWLQAYKIEAFCTYCLISAFDSLILFVLISLITFKNKEVKNANKNSSSRKTKK